MVSEGAVQLVLAEEAGRLCVFTYNKQSTESRGGKLLLPQASFHLGDPVCYLQRLQLRGGHVLFYATHDGALGFLMPLSEAEHRRLAFLSNKLLHALPHCAGLNPRAFRAGVTRTASSRELKHVLDGGLLRQFASLDGEQQSRIARQIGTTAQQLLRNLDAFRLSI